MSYSRRETCRVCEGSLQDVLDLGLQCSQGAFPGKEEGYPPAYPLVLARCLECSLVQLRDTAASEELYESYWYRSSVSQTMQNHLKALLKEAVGLLPGGECRHLLDIGGNDGFLAGQAHQYGIAYPWVIDPSDIARQRSLYASNDRIVYVGGFFPEDANALGSSRFDLITSVAMFYDIDDPVSFACAVKKHLATDGLWCVEVGYLPYLLANGDYSSICAEHLCYYAGKTLWETVARAGLEVRHMSFNNSNGGSLRMYFGHDRRYGPVMWPKLPECDLVQVPHLDAFADGVYRHRDYLRQAIKSRVQRGQRIHLLGASTKLNTVLQFCDLTHHDIEAASDRDERKYGRRTPGSNIPIVSEEESRTMKPDAYLVGPWHFREELIAREREAGFAGELIFPFPELEVVSLKEEAVPA